MRVSSSIKNGFGIGCGIIAAVVLVYLIVTMTGIVTAVSWQSASDRSVYEKAKATQISISSLGLALEMYAVDNGNYPTTEQGLKALLERNVKPNTKLVDAWGNPYIYKFPSGREGYDYDLFSFGPDGRESGDDI